MSLLSSFSLLIVQSIAKSASSYFVWWFGFLQYVNIFCYLTVVPWIEKHVPQTSVWTAFQKYGFDIRLLPIQKLLPGGQMWLDYLTEGLPREPDQVLN